MSYLDFDAIKAEYPINEIADRLGLTLKPSGKQMRGKCCLLYTSPSPRDS